MTPFFPLSFFSPFFRFLFPPFFSLLDIERKGRKRERKELDGF